MFFNTLRDWNRNISWKYGKAIGLVSQDNHSSKFLEYYKNAVTKHLETAKGKKETLVLDVGCGKKSLLSEIDKTTHNFVPFGIDISSLDLAQNTLFDKENRIVYNVCNPLFESDLKEQKEKFDLVVSHAVLEHLPDPTITHRLIHYLLKRGGVAIHLYPTLYDPLLFAAHLLPEPLSRNILFFIEPFRKDGGKFKTFYKFCRGFSKPLRDYYNTFGFSVTAWQNFYGSWYLYSFSPLQILLDTFYYLPISRLKIPLLSTYSCITLQKK